MTARKHLKLVVGAAALAMLPFLDAREMRIGTSPDHNLAVVVAEDSSGIAVHIKSSDSVLTKFQYVPTNDGYAFNSGKGWMSICRNLSMRSFIEIFWPDGERSSVPISRVSPFVDGPYPRGVHRYIRARVLVALDESGPKYSAYVVNIANWRGTKIDPVSSENFDLRSDKVTRNVFFSAVENFFKTLPTSMVETNLWMFSGPRTFWRLEDAFEFVDTFGKLTEDTRKAILERSYSTVNLISGGDTNRLVIEFPVRLKFGLSSETLKTDIVANFDFSSFRGVLTELTFAEARGSSTNEFLRIRDPERLTGPINVTVKGLLADHALVISYKSNSTPGTVIFRSRR